VTILVMLKRERTGSDITVEIVVFLQRACPS